VDPTTGLDVLEKRKISGICEEQKGKERVANELNRLINLWHSAFLICRCSSQIINETAIRLYSHLFKSIHVLTIFFSPRGWKGVLVNFQIRVNL